jgi:hypothetical protein
MGRLKTEISPPPTTADSIKKTKKRSQLILLNSLFPPEYNRIEDRAISWTNSFPEQYQDWRKRFHSEGDEWSNLEASQSQPSEESWYLEANWDRAWAKPVLISGGKPWKWLNLDRSLASSCGDKLDDCF